MAYPGSSSTRFAGNSLSKPHPIPVVAGRTWRATHILHRALVVTAPLVWRCLGLWNDSRAGVIPRQASIVWASEIPSWAAAKPGFVPQCFLEALNALA